MKAPEYGLTTKCKLTRIIDADTIEVELTRKITVRLLDLYAPEKNTEEGKRLIEYLTKILNKKDLILHIPASDRLQIKDIFTFGRVLGYIWTEDDINQDISKKIKNEMVYNTT